MRLVSITLRNYRIHRDLTVNFDPSRTVIGGPNETGKTTVVEAVHRALFLRAKATGEVLRSMQSHFHDEHPSVALTFESDGTTYTVTKQFTGGPSASTTLAQPGKEVLRNDQAEAKLREIIATDQIQGRNVEERLKTQWGHLWVWQGTAAESPLGERHDEPLGRLRERLGSLDEGGVMESRVDASVGQAVATMQAQRTKADGSPKVDSPLGQAEAAVEEARRKVALARATIAALDAAVATIAQADSTIAESENSLAARRQEQEENDRRGREARSLEVLKAEQHAVAREAAGRLTALVDADRQIRECDAVIAAVEARRQPVQQEQAEAVAALAAAETRLATARGVAQDCRRRHADLADLAELHRQAEHLERRVDERSKRAGRRERIVALRRDVEELELRLAPLPSLGGEQLRELAALERGRDAAQAKLDAIATRVELLSGTPAVRLGDRDLVSGDPQTITTAAELRMADVVLRISPGGGTSAAEAMLLRDNAVAAVETRLRELMVADGDDARRIQLLRQTLESEIAATRSAIRDLGGDTIDGELADLDAEIAELEAELEASPQVGFSRPVGIDAATVALRTVNDQLREVGHAMTSANAEEQAAEQLLAAAGTRRDEAAEATREIDRTVNDTVVRRRFLVEQHGEDREDAIAAATTAATTAAETLATTTAALSRLQPELLEQTTDRLRRAIDKLQTARQTALTDRTVAFERLRTEGTLDPRADLAMALAAERVAVAALGQAAREARAYALLARAFTEKRAEIESRFVAPLANRVAGYLQCLFGAAATVSVCYESGKNGGKAFTGYALSRPDFGGVPIPFERLSGGAREQAAAAFRLAMAEILAAEHGGCLPIVFDDAFVNSDTVRLGAVQAMLDRAATNGLQVIVLSCNQRDYDGLGAEVVTLPRLEFAGVAAARRVEQAAEQPEPSSGRAGRSSA